MEFLFLTGMSGAGKSQAANVLEDIGYYCIDNMPAALILPFADIYTQSPGKFTKVAFVVDTRGEMEFDTLKSAILRLRENGNSCRLIFLDCADVVLSNRYRESRRMHPLAAKYGISVSEALAKERALLATLHDQQDYFIDTTNLTVRQLKEKLNAILLGKTEGSLLVSCVSFGFKYGILQDADLVFDVRCFKNPYWEPALREKTGLDEEVRAYVFSDPHTEKFLTQLEQMLDELMPLYMKEGKTQLTIGIGCTGGKHRSVAITEELCLYLRTQAYNVISLHRDIIKKSAVDK